MAISKTTDNGASWSRDTLETAYSTCNALRADPTRSSYIYTGGNTGFYKSTDAGASWFKSSTGLSGTVNDIAIDPDNSTVLYAATSNSVYKSTNSGASWNDMGLNGVTSIVIDVTTVTTIYVGTTTGVYYSTNGGSSWTAMNEGLLIPNVTSLGVYHDNYLYAGTDGAGMWRWEIVVGVAEDKEEGMPRILTCHPKPARDLVTIRYALNRELVANVSIYDIQGRLVTQLIREKQATGDHSVIWHGEDARGNDVPAGVYFCKLATQEGTAIEKIILVR